MGTSSYPGFVPPPTGVTPDLNNPEDAEYSLLLGWLIACSVLTAIFFLGRAYTKLWILRTILPEDVTCAIAWVLFMIYSASVAISLPYGLGHHAWEISPGDYSQIRKWLYAGTVVYCPASYFTKVTLLLIMARIFMVKEQVARGIYIFIGGLLLAYLPIQFVKIFVCSPIRAYWDTSAKGSCLNQTQIFLADISLAILTDFVILIMPIPLIWSLRVSRWKKIKVVVLLGAGGAATAATTYRQVLAVQFMTSEDVTTDFAVIIITVLLELSIGLICSCMPTIHILADKYNITWPSRFRRFLGDVSSIMQGKRGSAKTTDERDNSVTLVTIGRISNRNGGGPKRPDTDLAGSFERLEDTSFQGSTDELYVNPRGTGGGPVYDSGSGA